MEIPGAQAAGGRSAATSRAQEEVRVERHERRFLQPALPGEARTDRMVALPQDHGVPGARGDPRPAVPRGCGQDRGDGRARAVYVRGREAVTFASGPFSCGSVATLLSP